MRAKRRKKAIDILVDLYNNPSNVLIIHYSCESFYNITDGHTPRITSIAVRYLNSAQAQSFSIHKTAEVKNIGINDIEEHYDELEKDMLAEFYKFVKEHKNYKWLHWNMRNINYGFQAINHRYIVLKGSPINIPDENKIDLARIFQDKYGVHYIKDPKLEKLIEKNKITKKDFMKGDEEAKAFINKEYIKLHQSTLRKVDIIHSLFEKAAENRLLTNSKAWDVYGFSPQGIFDMIRDNWLANIIFSTIGVIFGLILNKVFK